MNRALLALMALIYAPFAQAQMLTRMEARAIAKEATIYGFPLVDSYRIQHSYFVDRSNPEAVFICVGADLRAEALVFTVPMVLFQIVDAVNLPMDPRERDV